MFLLRARLGLGLLVKVIGHLARATRLDEGGDELGIDETGNCASLYTIRGVTGIR
jgi:hypothetical protein